jgi:hypothetical protein
VITVFVENEVEESEGYMIIDKVKKKEESMDS